MKEHIAQMAQSMVAQFRGTETDTNAASNGAASTDSSALPLPPPPPVEVSMTQSLVSKRDGDVFHDPEENQIGAETKGAGDGPPPAKRTKT